jgi:hypothetical protein
MLSIPLIMPIKVFIQHAPRATSPKNKANEDFKMEANYHIPSIARGTTADLDDPHQKALSFNDPYDSLVTLGSTNVKLKFEVLNSA